MNNIDENDALVHETLNLLEGQQKMGMQPSTSWKNPVYEQDAANISMPPPPQPQLPMPPTTGGLPMPATPGMTMPQPYVDPRQYMAEDVYPTPSPPCKSIWKCRIGSLLCMLLVVFLPLNKWITMLLPMLKERQFLFSLLLIVVVIIIYIVFMKIFNIIIPFVH